MRREVAPFWGFTLIGYLGSTGTVQLADTLTKSHDVHGLPRVVAIMGAQLFAYGIVWIVKFLVFNRIVFAVRPTGTEGAGGVAGTGPQTGNGSGNGASSGQAHTAQARYRPVTERAGAERAGAERAERERCWRAARPRASLLKNRARRAFGWSSLERQHHLAPRWPARNPLPSHHPPGWPWRERPKASCPMMRASHCTGPAWRRVEAGWAQIAETVLIAPARPSTWGQPPGRAARCSSASTITSGPSSCSPVGLITTPRWSTRRQA